jgi:hypothetical protein
MVSILGTTRTHTMAGTIHMHTMVGIILATTAGRILMDTEVGITDVLQMDMVTTLDGTMLDGTMVTLVETITEAVSTEQEVEDRHLVLQQGSLKILDL